MPLSQDDFYKAHVANLRAVEAGLAATYQSIKHAVARCDEKAERSHLRVYLLLLGTWTEARLRKLSFEPNGFTAEEREVIVDGERRSQIKRWERALEIGFGRRHLPNSLRRPTEANVPATPWLQLSELKALLTGDLAPIIEMRNSLAHGQWNRTFNSNHTEISSTQLVALNQENALTAKFKLKLVKVLSNLIHDLVAGNNAYIRDFDVHFGHLKNIRRNLRNRSYTDLKSKLITKYQRGRIEMRSSILSSAREH